MGTIAFFPWMHIREAVSVEGFELLPYRRGSAPAGAGKPEQESIDKLLEPYRTAPRGRLGAATLLRLTGRDLLDNVTDDEADAALRFGELVAFSGLSARTFFDQIGYASRDNFRLIVQRFEDPASGLTVLSRRRDGSTWTAITRSALIVLKPYHVSGGPWQAIDVPLLAALVQRSRKDYWGEIEEAIIGFNSANTDSPDVREESEAVALVGSFERALGLRGGDEHELAQAFRESVVPREEMKPAECPRIANSPRREKYERYGSVREAWVRDFFRLRGEHAHGKISPRYTSLWSLREHLLFASFVFPLLVKSRLSREGIYALRMSDVGYVQAIEPLLGQDNFTPNEDLEFPGFPWSETISTARTQAWVENWLSQLGEQEGDEGSKNDDDDGESEGLSGDPGQPPQ